MYNAICAFGEGLFPILSIDTR